VKGAKATYLHSEEMMMMMMMMMMMIIIIIIIIILFRRVHKITKSDCLLRHVRLSVSLFSGGLCWKIMKIALDE